MWCLSTHKPHILRWISQEAEWQTMSAAFFRIHLGFLWDSWLEVASDSCTRESEAPGNNTVGRNIDRSAHQCSANSRIHGNGSNPAKEGRIKSEHVETGPLENTTTYRVRGKATEDDQRRKGRNRGRRRFVRGETNVQN